MPWSPTTNPVSSSVERRASGRTCDLQSRPKKCCYHACARTPGVPARTAGNTPTSTGPAQPPGTVPARPPRLPVRTPRVSSRSSARLRPLPPRPAPWGPP
eukprot:1219858-Rhodomonas_salina.1